MAPMALFALMDAGGADHSAAIRKGLEWLWYSPEIDGACSSHHVQPSTIVSTPTVSQIAGLGHGASVG